MKRCPYCGTENKDDAFRCKNEDCTEILPQNKAEEKSDIKSDKINIVSQRKFVDNPRVFSVGRVDTSVKPKRLLQLLLIFFVLGLLMYGVMNYQYTAQKEGEKASRYYADERRSIQKSREAAEHAREYWGKRYEGWEQTVGYPAKLKGKRGELGLTPVYYPSLGIIVIINDDNQIIHVEQK